MSTTPETQDDDQSGLVRALFGHPEVDTPPAVTEAQDDDQAALVKAIFGGESR